MKYLAALIFGLILGAVLYTALTTLAERTMQKVERVVKQEAK